MILIRGLVTTILGLFGINQFTKEDGVSDRVFESPIGQIGYLTVSTLLIITIYNIIKDLK